MVSKKQIFASLYLRCVSKLFNIVISISSEKIGELSCIPTFYRMDSVCTYIARNAWSLICFLDH